MILFIQFLQPLHVGFTSDRGGNTINVHWYTRKQVLHHVSDTHFQTTKQVGNNFNSMLILKHTGLG